MAGTTGPRSSSICSRWNLVIMMMLMLLMLMLVVMLLLLRLIVKVIIRQGQSCGLVKIWLVFVVCMVRLVAN
jgi:hypothetical protein